MQNIDFGAFPSGLISILSAFTLEYPAICNQSESVFDFQFIATFNIQLMSILIHSYVTPDLLGSILLFFQQPFQSSFSENIFMLQFGGLFYKSLGILCGTSISSLAIDFHLPILDFLAFLLQYPVFDFYSALVESPDFFELLLDTSADLLMAIEDEDEVTEVFRFLALLVPTNCLGHSDTENTKKFMEYWREHDEFEEFTQDPQYQLLDNKIQKIEIE